MEERFSLPNETKTTAGAFLQMFLSRMSDFLKCIGEKADVAHGSMGQRVKGTLLDATWVPRVNGQAALLLDAQRPSAMKAVRDSLPLSPAPSPTNLMLATPKFCSLSCCISWPRETAVVLYFLLQQLDCFPVVQNFNGTADLLHSDVVDLDDSATALRAYIGALLSCAHSIEVPHLPLSSYTEDVCSEAMPLEGILVNNLILSTVCLVDMEVVDWRQSRCDEGRGT
ncbi:hypothetical protein BV25DRAFT_1823446 [Artomyces pyxidatus]|uniref:Uncharacterized protein n=1 Tax=Artomyces pyxidatus TaxID=48021 RepID=A0ACB8T5B7_9AGAM|nr:hypothetical protein BV25DRAFT_1823446 [Artomyces pyxidatus]